MAALVPEAEPTDGGGGPHAGCPFTGRALCTCIYGSSIAAQQQQQQGQQPNDGSVAADVAAAARQHMLQARAAWRLLHGPDSSQEPVAIMLPRLERQAPTPGSAEAAAAAAAAAAARLQRAEAAAQAAALRAASLAGASGLPYRPPEGLSVDLSGVTVTDLSELERQVAAVRRAQEARQAAAAAAAAAAKASAGSGQLPLLPPAGEAPPMVLPLAALVHGTRAALPAATPDAPEGMPAAAAGGTPHERPASLSGTGRPLRRTRSHDVAGAAPPGALAHGNLSMPLPGLSASSGGPAGVPASSSRPRRSPAGKPPAKPSSARASRGTGPGKGPRGKGSKQAASAHEGHAPPGSAERPGGQPPDLSRFGEGYQARGPSAATPPKSWLLKAKDLKAGLQGKLVQTFWPDGGQWWPAMVLHVSLADKLLTLLYETGDEEEVQYPLMVHAGELAWLLGPSGGATPRAAVHSPSPNRSSQQQQQGGTPPGSVRRQPSGGRTKSPQHASTASAPEAEPAAAALQEQEQQQQQMQPAKSASGELGLSGSLGEPGGPLQRDWPPLGDPMELEGRGSSPQLLGGSGPVGTSSEGIGALLPPLSVGGTHGFGSSLRLGGHRGSELLLVDNPAFGGLGLLPSLHLDSPAELPQQLAAAAEQQQKQQQPHEEQQQQHQPQEGQEQGKQQQQPQLRAVEQRQEEQPDAAPEQQQLEPDDPQQQPQEQHAKQQLLDEGPQQPAQQAEQQLQVQHEDQTSPQQQSEQPSAMPPELQAAEQQLQQQAQPPEPQPGSPMGSEQLQEGEQQAAEEGLAAEHQAASEEGLAAEPPLRQSLQHEQQADCTADASGGSAQPAPCCSGGRCGSPACTPGLPNAEGGCRQEAACAPRTAEEAAAGKAGGSAHALAAAESMDDPLAAGDAATGAPAAAAEESSEMLQAAVPTAAEREPPPASLAAAAAAATQVAEEQPPAAEPAQQEDALHEAAAEGAGQGAPSGQQSDEQPPPPPPEGQPPPPAAEEPDSAAKQPAPAAQQPGPAAQHIEPTAQQPGPAVQQPVPAAASPPAHPAGAPASQLPPALAAAAVQAPPGYRLASAWELLDLGHGAVGCPLAVATLPSGIWQSAHVRQCSAAHGLLQVQCEQEGMLLTAQEEGVTFLLSLPRNGS